MGNNTVFFIIALVFIIFIGIVIVLNRYSYDIRAARQRIDSMGSQVIETKFGPIEYTLVGEGNPVLVVHGALGGFDQGLFLAHSTGIPNSQTISISRFGFLRSPVPQGATLNTQADIFAALLDALEIPKAVVLAVSAGSTSAIRFAARHPNRVTTLSWLVLIHRGRFICLCHPVF
jgi:pimeloyl-ACP methyl ester carboxylesterase